MLNLRNISMLVFAVMLISGTSHANMKKGSIGNQGTKVFAFTNSFDGPCTASLIFDNATADLDTGFIFPDTEDVLLCFSASAQKNFDSCTVGLPPNNYQVFVNSFKGSSNFRLVVNCGGQETIGSAGQRAGETELREIEPDANTRKLQQKLNRIAPAMKQ
jgi:hypothetical protein